MEGQYSVLPESAHLGHVFNIGPAQTSSATAILPLKFAKGQEYSQEQRCWGARGAKLTTPQVCVMNLPPLQS